MGWKDTQAQPFRLKARGISMVKASAFGIPSPGEKEK